MKTGRVGLGTDRRVSMKFHRIAWVMALMLASYGVPSALAQDSQKQDSKDQNTPSNTTQTEPQPVAQPDNSKDKHDAGKNDVDAIGNRKLGGQGLRHCDSIAGE